MKPILLIVTGCSCVGTDSVQGVMHVWPCTVVTAAPAGSDAKLKFCNCGPSGFDDIQSGIDGIQSGIPLEQLPSATLITAAAAATTSRTRDMTPSVPKGRKLGRPNVPVKPGKAENGERRRPRRPAADRADASSRKPEQGTKLSR